MITRPSRKTQRLISQAIHLDSETSRLRGIGQMGVGIGTRSITSNPSRPNLIPHWGMVRPLFRPPRFKFVPVSTATVIAFLLSLLLKRRFWSVAWIDGITCSRLLSRRFRTLWEVVAGRAAKYRRRVKGKSKRRGNAMNSTIHSESNSAVRILFAMSQWLSVVIHAFALVVPR